MVKIACYDISKKPVSFDFLTFAVAAKIRGYEHIRIGFTGSYANKDYQDYDERMESIVKKIPAMLDMEYSVGPVEGDELDHLAGAVLRAYQETGRIEFIHGMMTPRPGDYVTITLRHSRRQYRNSDTEAWKAAASKWAGEIVWIPDYVDRKIDLYERIALYEGAWMNFHVSNGTAALCMYSHFPYAVLLMHGRHEDSNGSRDRKYLDAQGMKSGFQFPWAAKNQRIFWCSDTEANINEAYQWAIENRHIYLQ